MCGSIPVGVLIARSRGIDIRQHGSGNIGATNVARVLGARLGLLCLGLDVLKGFAPTFMAGLVGGLVQASIVARPITTVQACWWLGVVGACVLGHMFSPFLRFRGGKGVATGLGAMLGVWPYLALPAFGALIVWIATAAVWRYVSFASCLAAISLPLWIWVFSFVSGSEGIAPFYLFTSVLMVLVVIKHRGNIRRLIAGTENRLGRRVDSETPVPD
jgi:acyl phosphate:glycerol-3-phosphate acyltransferase